MPALREIQAAFLHDIYSGERTSAVYLAESKFGSPARLDIYVNNALFGLTDILAGAYPVVQKIVGEEFFKTAARHYLKAHPQPAGNRHEFGAEFSSFLRSFEPAATLPYLPDIAALEWAYFQAEIADDAGALDVQELAGLITAQPDFGLTFHPSVRLVDLRFNALEIWQVHQEAEIGSITLCEKRETIAVWRGPEDVVLLKNLSAPLRKLLVSCQEGESFAEAMAKAAEGLPELQAFQQEFAQTVLLGVFAGNRG
jgi:hypothetical protein